VRADLRRGRHARRESPGLGLRDRFDAGVLLALALLSLWVLALMLGRAGLGELTWAGVDGLHVSDQMQYLAWIRDAGQGALIPNRYRLEPTQASFLHPGFLLSGGLSALGVPAWLAYLAWKPVAVVALFLAVRAYVGVSLAGLGRRCALLLALFSVPVAAFVADLLPGTSVGELYLDGLAFDFWPGSWLWGYSFTALAVAALVAALLSYARDRRDGTIRPWTPLLGLVCSWLQPWQGATLLIVVVAAEGALALARGPAGTRERPALRLALVTVAATAAPLVYYAALSRYDPSWAIAREGNLAPEPAPLWPLAATLGPLALPALLAYRRRAPGFHAVALRLWVPVAVGVYLLIERLEVGTFPLHAVQGLSIPLAVLACEGVATLRPASAPARRGALVAGVAVGLLLVPAGAWRLVEAARSVRNAPAPSILAPGEPFFLQPGERAALRRLEQGPVAGVLTPGYLGQLVPGLTGRNTWVGVVSWTPDFAARSALAETLFDGRMAAAEAQAFVRSTGAGLLLQDCLHPQPLEPLLRPLIASVRRFGCATVYELGR